MPLHSSQTASDIPGPRIFLPLDAASASTWLLFLLLLVMTMDKEQCRVMAELRNI